MILGHGTQSRAINRDNIIWAHLQMSDPLPKQNHCKVIDKLNMNCHGIKLSGRVPKPKCWKVLQQFKLEFSWKNLTFKMLVLVGKTNDKLNLTCLGRITSGKQ